MTNEPLLVDGIARSHRVDHWTAAERAIQEAVDVCERTLPADELETAAVILLGDARAKVAQLVDREIRAGRMAMPSVPAAPREDDGRPHICPVCNGAKHVSRPPHIAGDVTEWVAAGSETYPCGVCNATGIVWSSPAPSSAGTPAGSEMLPCPFCGFDAAEETIVDKNDGVAYTPWYQAVCHKCDFALPGSRDEAEAIAQWNRRAAGPAPSPARAVEADDERIREIESRLNVTTKGPWQHELTHGSVSVWQQYDALSCIASCGAVERSNAVNDAAFIAHARQDIPWLLTALRAARSPSEASSAPRE